MAYRLQYWSGMPGRGEPLRLALEDTGTAQVDVGRLPASQGGGDATVARILRTGTGLCPLAPPVLEQGSLRIAQAAQILQWLAPRIGLASFATTDELDAPLRRSARRGPARHRR